MIEHPTGTEYKVICIKDSPLGFKVGTIYNSSVLLKMRYESVCCFIYINPNYGEIFYSQTTIPYRGYDNYFECLSKNRKRKIDLILEDHTVEDQDYD